jgi:PAS domain S-box-containing protein
LHAPEYHYYRALSLASAYRDGGAAERRELLEALREHDAQLREWSDHCPENFASKSALVSAEVARIAGDDDEAMRLYERAIRAAAENGLVHNEAIAYELASRFWRARGFAAFADTYLRSARACYARWGAEGKVRQLEAAHPHLRPEQPPAERSTMGAPVEHLELATVLEISHAVSGEIVLEKLIDSVMRTAIEHAGAKRGLLILPGDHELRIQAEATTGTGAIAVALRDARISSAELPESVVQYAARTGEIVLLDDASARGAFTADEYVQREHARSVLCVPLVKQGRAVALLYLENDLAAGVFTPARFSVLSVLAAHAATSLENARLFTERNRAEDELRRSQSYLAEAQRLSHTGSFGWNVSTGEISWSAETYRIFAVAPATPPTIALVLERTHPDDRSAVEAAIRRAEREGRGFDLEQRLLMPDGSLKHLHVVARAITDDAGRREFAGAVMDVTARKRSEEDLRASESRYRTLLDFAADGFMIHDDSGAVVDVNRQTCENLGRSREELIGMTTAEFDAYLDDATMRTVMERVAAGETITFETRHRRKDGTVFPVEVRARRVHYGERVFAISLSRDITERKRAEEEREKLRHAEADLARISRVTTLGEFTASLAHEIRQPIAATITNAKACIRWLERDRPDVREAREAASRIVAEGNRAADIVTRVRALYKNDAPRQERVDVNDVVRETLALLHSEALRHEVSIRAELAPDLPAATGDRVQLQQVLVNLILNALEATDAAPGVVRIASARGGEGELLVTVSDEGIGLPQGAADRIFDAFFTTKRQGTGMGLAISRSIVESHGGRLWAAPAEPRGTSFHVSLPAADPKE